MFVCNFHIFCTILMKFSVRILHIMLFQQVCVLWKATQGRTCFFCERKWNYIYVCTAKPHDIVKVNDALVTSACCVTECTTGSLVKTCPRNVMEMHNWNALQTTPHLVWRIAQSCTRLYSPLAPDRWMPIARNLTEHDKRMEVSAGQDAVRKLLLSRCEIRVLQPAYRNQGHAGVCPVTPPLLRKQVAGS